MEFNIYLRFVAFFSLSGLAGGLTCTRQNTDGTLGSFTCGTYCCGDLRNRVCCSPLPGEYSKKSLASEYVAVVITVTVVGLLAAGAFTLFMWTRQKTQGTCAESPPNPAPRRHRAEHAETTRPGHLREEYNTGISGGLGANRAFPSRTNPTLMYGFGNPDLDTGLSSMEPGYASSDRRDDASVYGGFFSNS